MRYFSSPAFSEINQLPKYLVRVLWTHIYTHVSWVPTTGKYWGWGLLRETHCMDSYWSFNINGEICFTGSQCLYLTQNCSIQWKMLMPFDSFSALLWECNKHIAFLVFAGRCRSTASRNQNRFLFRPWKEASLLSRDEKKLARGKHQLERLCCGQEWTPAGPKGWASLPACCISPSHVCLFLLLGFNQPFWSWSHAQGWVVPVNWLTVSIIGRAILSYRHFIPLRCDRIPMNFKLHHSERDFLQNVVRTIWFSFRHSSFFPSLVMLLPAFSHLLFGREENRLLFQTAKNKKWLSAQG